MTAIHYKKHYNENTTRIDWFKRRFSGRILIVLEIQLIAANKQRHWIINKLAFANASGNLLH